jgi:hypothetical protein
LFVASDSSTDEPVISVDNDYYCSVQWENSNIISTVPQLTILKSPEFTRLNDVCFVEIEEEYRKAKIVFKG